MMFDYSELTDWIFDNSRRLLFPEEWISLDLSLSKTELVTLILVDRRGELIMSALSDFLGVPMSTTTGIVDRLAKSGHLLRERNEKDRRIVTIRLTEKGRTVIGAIRATVSSFIALMGQALSEEEQKQLSGILAKVGLILGKKIAESESIAGREGLRRIEIG